MNWASKCDLQFDLMQQGALQRVQTLNWLTWPTVIQGYAESDV